MVALYVGVGSVAERRKRNSRVEQPGIKNKTRTIQIKHRRNEYHK